MGISERAREREMERNREFGHFRERERNRGNDGEVVGIWSKITRPRVFSIFSTKLATILIEWCGNGDVMRENKRRRRCFSE